MKTPLIYLISVIERATRWFLVDNHFAEIVFQNVNLFEQISFHHLQYRKNKIIVIIAVISKWKEKSRLVWLGTSLYKFKVVGPICFVGTLGKRKQTLSARTNNLYIIRRESGPVSQARQRFILFCSCCFFRVIFLAWRRLHRGESIKTKGYTADNWNRYDFFIFLAFLCLFYSLRKKINNPCLYTFTLLPKSK